ncbi:MAG: hypothetical protein HND58_04015 [Planctomycetota bacterium]|nr:MAG: hypothetical protein HND58_04015 [Planctomycetota bacterium]
MEVVRVPEFSIYLADRPGELAGVLEALAAAGAKVTALSVVETVNGVDRKGLVRLIGEPAEAIRRVCESVADTGAGPVSESEVLVVSLGEHPGRFREVAVRLADERVNVRYLYQCPSMMGEGARFVLRVEDPAKAEEIVRDLTLPASGTETGLGGAAGAA